MLARNIASNTTLYYVKRLELEWLAGKVVRC